MVKMIMNLIDGGTKFLGHLRHVCSHIWLEELNDGSTTDQLVKFRSVWSQIDVQKKLVLQVIQDIQAGSELIAAEFLEKLDQSRLRFKEFAKLARSKDTSLELCAIIRSQSTNSPVNGNVVL